MNSKQIAFAAIFMAIILGSIVAAGYLFTDWFHKGQDQGLPDQYQQISFEQIDWKWEGDLLTIVLHIKNDGTENAEIGAISVKDEASDTKYSWYNPDGVSSGSTIIPVGETEIFEWDILKADAPWDFLLPGRTYVVTADSHDSYCQQTVAAPSM